MVVGANRFAGDTAAEVETLYRRPSVSNHVRRLPPGQGSARLQKRKACAALLPTRLRSFVSSADIRSTIPLYC